jgi:hypothetical protein
MPRAARANEVRLIGEIKLVAMQKRINHIAAMLERSLFANAAHQNRIRLCRRHNSKMQWRQSQSSQT